MKKLITKKEIIPLAILVAIIAVSIALYPSLPEQIPSHWNTAGQVDKYASKNFTVFFFPSLILFIYLLITFLPFIDPLKKNIEKSSEAYFYLKTVLVAFFALIYGYTLASGIAGAKNFPINLLILPTLGLMLIFIGFLLPKFKRNYFVGIRTPWTLESEEVWNITHKRAKKWFILAGLTVIMGAFIKVGFLWFFIPMLAFLLWPVVESYLIFKKLKK